MSDVTRTVRSDWYSGIEREYEVSVEISLDWHTQAIDSFDYVRAVDMIFDRAAYDRGAGGLIHLPREILDAAFVESLRLAVQEAVCPGVVFA